MRFLLLWASTFLYIAGLSAVVYGFWLLFHPLGWIIGGVFLFAIALLIDRMTKEADEPR